MAFPGTASPVTAVGCPRELAHGDFCFAYGLRERQRSFPDGGVGNLRVAISLGRTLMPVWLLTLETDFLEPHVQLSSDSTRESLPLWLLTVHAVFGMGLVNPAGFLNFLCFMNLEGVF